MNGTLRVTHCVIITGTSQDSSGNWDVYMCVRVRARESVFSSVVIHLVVFSISLSLKVTDVSFAGLFFSGCLFSRFFFSVTLLLLDVGVKDSCTNNTVTLPVFRLT